ncbi:MULTISPECIES: NifU family protein [Rhodococcus]|jgi:Fe-S cluster biogenesis protein NfuA/nitrite reductase/ring-hydroxylating ferredoxin subunit|uniref:NifU family protein n=1 Tax=Rhodococcus oxybenzonivorans TaxID=1990687 RepID=A0AAE5A6J3_9NOCA|nr:MULTISPECIES: NifU family protein [Rhodococcus]MDV7241194.1 NifU family protein [Rhodococcus oxybenzonivorans]MDV7265672.1 NifU family protein [Rhodococcus oxybenzonivorans]MDV7273467.1 NifU family protein [Rhodococcus oxybenzonivorans]MDV7332795.1 NifU family protein [Rhodococcus oxybenzonivorans]MDV7341961.1 NifU family protein [Rhodococcus oxybenzonivorans]
MEEAGVDGPDRWRTAGERIDALLDASSAGGAVARERAEQLVREVVELYGAGLERMLEIVGEQDGALVDRLAADELVASLLLVNGLHPHDVETRVATALDSVRPYLGSHGGDVELLGVTDGVVQLRLTGSCQSCPSSAVTLELAVKDAVYSAAPETVDIEVVGAKPEAGSGLIATESLFSHVHAHESGTGTWVSAPDIADLASGEVGGFSLAGLPVLVCRIGEQLFAFRDRCAACTNSLAGATLQRRAGGKVGDAVLRCPTCRAHFDPRGAGKRLDGDPEAEPLAPLPVLVRDGVISVAVPAAEVA